MLDTGRMRRQSFTPLFRAQSPKGLCNKQKILFSHGTMLNLLRAAVRRKTQHAWEHSLFVWFKVFSASERITLTAVFENFTNRGEQSLGRVHTQGAMRTWRAVSLSPLGCAGWMGSSELSEWEGVVPAQFLEVEGSPTSLALWIQLILAGAVR